MIVISKFNKKMCYDIFYQICLLIYQLHYAKLFYFRPMRNIILILFIGFVYVSCENANPNVDSKGKDELVSLEVEHQPIDEEFEYHDIVYVPIYSDIYVDSQNQRNLLSATLSIRNTSFNDSLFISKIDYFNTGGQIVRSYLQKTISLPPMATINYVIEEHDEVGGPGANFIVELSSRNSKTKPIIQAVMIGQLGNKAFSFVTDALSIKNQAGN